MPSRMHMAGHNEGIWLPSHPTTRGESQNGQFSGGKQIQTDDLSGPMNTLTAIPHKDQGGAAGGVWGVI